MRCLVEPGIVELLGKAEHNGQDEATLSATSKSAKNSEKVCDSELFIIANTITSTFKSIPVFLESHREKGERPPSRPSV
jgi:hypothetical protein